MHVLEVLPLSVLPPQVPQILSYYHDEALPKGAVVEVSLHNRPVEAAVIDSYDLDKQKIMVKKSIFQLKKISEVIDAEPIIKEWQFKFALWLSQRYVAPLGLCMKAVLPPFFLKPRYPILETASGFNIELTSPPPSFIVTRAKNSERQIRSLLKNSGAGQTLVIVPDTSYIPYFSFPDLNPLILTSATPNKDYYRIWNKVGERETQLIVGTRQALFLPFGDLKRIIVIDPLHEFYKSDMSPKYWTPELAAMVARHYGARLVSISALLGVEAYSRSKFGEIQVSDAMQPWPAEISVIDLTAEIKEGYVNVFAQTAKDLMRETLEQRNKILIMAARRGYTGILLCKRCGYSFKCPDCDLPMRIHQGMELSLVCHHCGKSQPYPNACPNCHSSQIKPTGPAGSQKIFEELQRMMTYGQLPRVPVLIIDSDVTQNETEETEVISQFKRSEPAILIGTQKVFSYGYDLEFQTIIIPQLDALAVSSDFQTTERLWYQLEKLADFEPKNILAQTFHQKELLPLLARHEYSKLYDQELALRQAFNFPPFSRLVKLSYGATDWRKVMAAARAAIEKLKMAAIHIQARDKVQITESSPYFLKKEKGIYTYNILLKIPVDFPARELLRYVPTQWLIDIDPRTTT